MAFITGEQVRQGLIAALKQAFEPQTCPRCLRHGMAGFEAHVESIATFVCPQCFHRWPVEVPDDAPDRGVMDLGKRCGSEWPGTPRVRCTLARGHEGRHLGGNENRWDWAIRFVGGPLHGEEMGMVLGGGPKPPGSRVTFPHHDGSGVMRDVTYVWGTDGNLYHESIAADDAAHAKA